MKNCPSCGQEMSDELREKIAIRRAKAEAYRILLDAGLDGELVSKVVYGSRKD